MIGKVSITPEVIAAYRAYYGLPGNSAGGSLHIVLDDGNREDKHIQWCFDDALKNGDVEGAALATAIMFMSKTQRRKLDRALGEAL